MTIGVAAEIALRERAGLQVARIAEELADERISGSNEAAVCAHDLFSVRHLLRAAQGARRLAFVIAVMVNVPLALIGAIIAMLITGGVFWSLRR